jgi:hypothetical protein
MDPVTASDAAIDTTPGVDTSASAVTVAVADSDAAPSTDPAAAAAIADDTARAADAARSTVASADSDAVTDEAAAATRSSAAAADADAVTDDDAPPTASFAAAAASVAVVARVADASCVVAPAAALISLTIHVQLGVPDAAVIDAVIDEPDAPSVLYPLTADTSVVVLLYVKSDDVGAGPAFSSNANANSHESAAVEFVADVGIVWGRPVCPVPVAVEPIRLAAATVPVPVNT